jgi:hypothetical protein
MFLKNHNSRYQVIFRLILTERIGKKGGLAGGTGLVRDSEGGINATLYYRS